LARAGYVWDPDNAGNAQDTIAPSLRSVQAARHRPQSTGRGSHWVALARADSDAIRNKALLRYRVRRRRLATFARPTVGTMWTWSQLCWLSRGMRLCCP